MTYDANSIRSLKGATRVRSRVGVMLGSNTVKGAFHTVKEIVSNSMDEVRAGFGNKIIVNYYEDGSVEVVDFGRGIPMDWNEEEQRYAWDMVFNELYAGGKYADIFSEGISLQQRVANLKKATDKYKQGLNGLGAASTQYSSEYTEVTSRRDNRIYTKKFEKGIPTDMELTFEPDENQTETGTTIRWKPDLEIFSSIDFTHRMFENYLSSQAHLNTVTIEFNNYMHDRYEVYEGLGLEGYLRSEIDGEIIDVLTASKEIFGIEDNEAYACKCDIIFAITEETQSKQLFFHNTAEMRTGAHIDEFTRVLDGFFATAGKEQGVRVKPSDYNEYVSVLISTYSNISDLEGQTKSAVYNGFIYQAINETLNDLIQTAVSMERESLKELLFSAVNAAVARKKAKETEEQAKLAGKNKRKRFEAPSKYVDFETTDRSEGEVYIVEGDSAMGLVKEARTRRNQSVFPLKGKIPNAMKKPLEKLLLNKEIMAMRDIIGTGLDIPGADTFNYDARRLDKIIFTTDADSDGQQIRVLLFIYMLVYMPKLLANGHVYVAQAPLYQFRLKKPRYNGDLGYFAYSIQERDEIQAKLDAEKTGISEIRRFKGLGQGTKEITRHTLMNPETRRLIQIKVDTKNPMLHVVCNTLFGVDPYDARQEFILKTLAEKGLSDGLTELVEMVTPEGELKLPEIQAI